MDRIDDIVERAIAYTRLVLATAPRHREVARDGLRRMCDNLLVGAPDHPALEKLKTFLESLDATPGSLYLN